MALPQEIEEKLARYTADVERVRSERLELSDSVDELLAVDGDAIPDETFDDPSVVREVNKLARTERRVRASASPVQPLRLGTGSGRGG